MADTELRPESSLAEFLTDRARHASDARLVVDVGAGLAVAVAVVLWRPHAWMLLVSAALCFAAFGAWGIADRELGGAPAARYHVPAGVLRGVRVAASLVGAVAALALLIGGLGFALGTWIS
jgi:hypothetical protein